MLEENPCDRVYGPYPDRGGKVRVVRVLGGKRTSEVYASESEALDAIRREARARPGQVSTGEALRMYVTYMRTKGNKVRSISTTEHRLTSLVKPCIDTPVREISGRQACDLYGAFAAKHAVDTHRNTLGQARTWGRWLVKSKVIRTNPWLEVEPMGQRAYGKDQLRIDEARKLWKYVRPRLLDDNGSCAVAVVLLLGLRASEVVSLAARDLDADGTILWIERGKTRNARRQLAVPGSLVAPLKELARLSRGGRLFPYRREWVLDVVKRRAIKSGLSADVTAHGLRGLHATLKVEYGDVQRALGHRVGSSVTERHYLEPGTVDRATARRVSELLGGDEDDE